MKTTIYCFKRFIFFLFILSFKNKFGYSSIIFKDHLLYQSSSQPNSARISHMANRRSSKLLRTPSMRMHPELATLARVICTVGSMSFYDGGLMKLKKSNSRRKVFIDIFQENTFISTKFRSIYLHPLNFPFIFKPMRLLRFEFGTESPRLVEGRFISVNRFS